MSTRTPTSRHERREQELRQRRRKPHRGHTPRRRFPGWAAPAIVIGVLALGIIGLRAAGVFEPGPAAANFEDARFAVRSGEVVGVKQKESGAGHITPRLQQQATYDQLPPTSGPHWDMPHSGWGVKDTPQEEELFVHNLEHGGIVISYNALTADDLSKLKTLVRQLNAVQYKKVMVHPYPKLADAKIAVAAWNWLLKLDAFDETQIVKFVRAHYGPAGEAPEPTAI